MELLLYTACSWLPSNILAFYQYWDFKWRSKKLAILLVCLLLVIKIPVVKLAAEAGYSVRMFELVFSALSASVYFIMVRTNPFKLVFTYVLVVDYLIIARGIAIVCGCKAVFRGGNVLAMQPDVRGRVSCDDAVVHAVFQEHRPRG